MKKLILLWAMFLVTSYGLFAEEQGSAIVANTGSDNQEAANDGKKELDLYPKNHKTFFLSVDNQTKLLNKLLESKGKQEVIRYYLSLKNHDSKKALELLSKSGNEDLRLVILENLPTEVFVELLNTLFEGIGGEAIAHWGYKTEGQLERNLFIIPNVRAQQYVNFFMKFRTMASKEVKDEEKSGTFTGEVKKTVYFDNETTLKSRGQKMAEVLNLMDDDKVIELLYGRPDTRFIGDRDQIVKGQAGHVQYSYSKAYQARIGADSYIYQTKEKTSYSLDKWEWKTRDEAAYNDHTWPSRVFSKSINYIIPHLKTKLIVSVFEKETKGDKDAFVELIKSLGCERAFNDLFEYLEDAVKDKVFESCNTDDSLFEMLGLGDSGNNVLAIGSGPEKQEEKKDL